MARKPIDWEVAGKWLAQGEVGVIPTDTLYGIVGSALKPAVVEKIYNLRRRERDKPMIVLIGGWEDLERFHIQVAVQTRAWLDKIWPGPVSVVLEANSAELAYLHRGTRGIAFRMPAKPELRSLLQSCGPLVAPSANLAGESAALSVEEANEYFGDSVFYVDDGILNNPPSALIDARVDPPLVLRPAPRSWVS